jgi:hypothetical protein
MVPVEEIRGKLHWFFLVSTTDLRRLRFELGKLLPQEIASYHHE